MRPGGSVDPDCTLGCRRLSRTLGQSVFVENRPGAGGNIGIESVVRGAHDGYTLLATPSGIAVNPSVYSKVPYNLDKDLTPLALVNRNAMIALVNPKSGINSLADLVARAKDKPGCAELRDLRQRDARSLVSEHLRVSTGVDMVRDQLRRRAEGRHRADGRRGPGDGRVGGVGVGLCAIRAAQGDRGELRAAAVDRARRADHDRARLQEFRDVWLGHAVRAERRAGRYRRQAARRRPGRWWRRPT